MWRKLIIVLALMGLWIGLLWAQEKKSERTDKPKVEKPAPPEEEPKISPELKAKIEELIKKLRDEDWQIREEAQKELIKIGRPAITSLKKASESEDPEVKIRANMIVDVIKWSLAEKKWSEFSRQVIAERRNRSIEAQKQNPQLVLREEYFENSLSFTLLPNYRFYPFRIKETQRVGVYALRQDGTIVNLGYLLHKNEFFRNLIDILNDNNIIVTDETQAEAVIKICQQLFGYSGYDRVRTEQNGNIWVVNWIPPQGVSTKGPYYWTIEVDNKGKIQNIKIGR